MPLRLAMIDLTYPKSTLTKAIHYAEAGFERLFVPSVSPSGVERMRDLIDAAWQRQQQQLQQAKDEREAALERRGAFESQVAAQLAEQSEWAGADDAEERFVGEPEFDESDGGSEYTLDDVSAEDEVADAREAEDEVADAREAETDVADASSDAIDEYSPEGDGDENEPEVAQPGHVTADEHWITQMAPTSADIAALDQRIEDLNARADALKGEQSSLDKWVRDRENSMLWRLTSLLHARTLQASADAAYFRELATSIPQTDSEEPKRARNEFANRLLLMLSLGALLAWLIVRFGDRIAEFLSVSNWVPWAVYGVIMFVWLLILLVSYYRRRSRFLATLRKLEHQQRDAMRQYQEAFYAEQRLRGLYQQMVDWGEILGYAVHDPWQPKESWFTGLPDADLAASLPTCVDLAVPDPNDKSGFRRLKREAILSLANEGWRSRAFNVLVERMLAEQDMENSAEAAAQLDLDSPATPNGSVRNMLELLRSDQLQPAAAEQVLSSKAANLYADRTTLASHALIPINSEYAAEDTDLLDAGSDLELMRPEWGDFLAGVLSGKTQFSVNLWSDEGMAQTATRQRMDTLAFAPPRMLQEVTEVGVEVISTRAADINRGVELSARCDFGPPVERSQVRFFAPSSQQRSAFESAVDHAVNNGEVGAAAPYVGPAPTGGPVSDGRTPETDVHVFN